MSRRLSRHEIYSLSQARDKVSRAKGIHRLNVERTKRHPGDASLLDKTAVSQEFLFRARSEEQAFIAKQKRARVF